MDDEEIALWGAAINPMATNFLKFALKDRDEFYEATDPEEKKRAARRFVAGLFAAAEAMAADDIGQWAYGDDPTDDAPHSEHLEVLTQRLRMIAKPYSLASSSGYKYSLPAVISEIEYMAHGQTPTALRPALRDANKAAKRKEIEHWARALKWVEFLRRSNKRKSDCEAYVAKKYDIGIDRFKYWRKRVLKELGQSYIDEIDRAAHRTPLSMRFRTEEEAIAALEADAKAYNDYLWSKGNT